MYLMPALLMLLNNLKIFQRTKLSMEVENMRFNVNVTESVTRSVKHQMMVVEQEFPPYIMRTTVLVRKKKL